MFVKGTVWPGSNTTWKVRWLPKSWRLILTHWWISIPYVIATRPVVELSLDQSVGWKDHHCCPKLKLFGRIRSCSCWTDSCTFVELYLIPLPDIESSLLTFVDDKQSLDDAVFFLWRTASKSTIKRYVTCNSDISNFLFLQWAFVSFCREYLRCSVTKVSMSCADLKSELILVIHSSHW